ncbi:MAG: flagellar biosynthesis protein FlhF [Lachnospira sp.]
MIVKKFQAATETEAIMKAKEELGSKAVVLNVKTLKQRGIFRLIKKDVVEITAALEEDEFINGINRNRPAFDNHIAAAGKPVRTSNYEAATAEPKNGGINLVANENIQLNPETAALEQKLDSLHSLLQTQINAASDLRNEGSNEIKDDDFIDEGHRIVKERENKNMKFLRLIYNKLIDNEVNEKYANQIIDDIESSLKKESNIDSILSAVYQKIILKLGEPNSIVLKDKPKVVFFIGPTGVGKTTTIAKIASKFKLEDNAKVAFITSDTYRIAAVEQLNTYAAIIDSPVSVVYSPEELGEYLEDYKNYDLIMVDTAGRSHHCEEQMTELEDLLDKAEEYRDRFDIDIYLTLSITTKYKDLVNITERYKDIKGWSVIFTKLDETCALGNVLNIRMLTGAQLSYTTTGQNVPNDIEIINQQALAKKILGGNE